MQFDDRLATVLRSSAGGEAASRTQLRQLLDLLGSMTGTEAGPAIDAAYARLDELVQQIPGAVQSKIIREPGLRLRNPALVAHLAHSEPQAAAAVMATAKLTDAEWTRLIPRLPLVARGLLRHRRNLPASAVQMLQRLGVQDLVLPEPAREVATAPPPKTPPAPNTAPLADDAAQGISRLVRRIEEFQRARRDTTAPQPAAPHLPMDGLAQPEATQRHRRFDFTTDAAGTVTWADVLWAPLVVGLSLAATGIAGAAPLDGATRGRMARRQPIMAAPVQLDGAPLVAGAWQMDAVPAFCPIGGAFTGYRGQMRRPAQAPTAAAAPPNPQADRMRQVLHELRTPVNAVQGFAEIIQQQLFGPVPNEYRALAAAVAVDAARLLGAFEDMDRLARLENHALDLNEGTSDLREITADLLRRLEGVLRPRSAQIELRVSGSPFTVPLDNGDAQMLVWRMLATLAGALAPGETILLDLAGDGHTVRLQAELPLTMADEADIFAGGTSAHARAVSAGMFGTGFTLRLARAEAEGIGGRLERHDELLTLSLPVPMHSAATHSEGDEAQGGQTAA